MTVGPEYDLHFHMCELRLGHLAVVHAHYPVYKVKALQYYNKTINIY